MNVRHERGRALEWLGHEDRAGRSSHDESQAGERARNAVDVEDDAGAAQEPRALVSIEAAADQHQWDIGLERLPERADDGGAPRAPVELGTTGTSRPARSMRASGPV